jgi:hypothetical protein
MNTIFYSENLKVRDLFSHLRDSRKIILKLIFKNYYLRLCTDPSGSSSLILNTVMNLVSRQGRGIS